jgi:hypothetical protein
LTRVRRVWTFALALLLVVDTTGDTYQPIEVTLNEGGA